MENNENAIDSMNTTQEEARDLLINLCENGFASDAEELALALGRDQEEIEEFLSGEGEIDEDLLMKIRGIAQEREIEIE